MGVQGFKEFAAHTFNNAWQFHVPAHLSKSDTQNLHQQYEALVS